MKRHETLALLGAMMILATVSTLTGCGCSRTEDTVSVNEVTVSENEAVSENIADVEETVSVNEVAVPENETVPENIADVEDEIGPDMIDYENSEDYDDAEEDPVLPGNSMTTITADDSNTSTPTTADDGEDFSDIWDKDPSQYTDEEVAYINSLFPGLPKDPRQMTDADWDSYFATAYGTPSGSGSSGGSTSTTDNSNYTPAAEGTVAPNGLIAGGNYDGNYGDGTATLY